VKSLFKISFVFIGFLTFISSFISSNSYANTYISVNDGQYDNCNIWTNGCAPNEIAEGDTVIINHDVDASSSLEISGVLIVNISGSLTLTNNVELDQSGWLEVYGTLVLTADLEMNGTMYNSGISIIETFRNRGYCCNSGTIKSSNSIYIQGGHIECGGTLLTCELDMNSFNGSTTVTGSPWAELNNQNICCENASDPNPLDDLNGSWIIDSISVEICTVPLMPNAGQDSSLYICNNTEAQVDLNTLLSPDANDIGSFGELSSSGSFNSVTGVLATDDLLPGTYSFTYTVNGYSGATDVANFTVTVNPTLSVTENLEICSNAFPFDWNGITITEAGSSSVNLVSTISGCDSIVTLNTTVIPIISTSETITICENDLPYNWNGLSIGQEGSESVVFPSSVTGCDSIVTLNLIVNAIPTSSTDTLVCVSQLPFLWNGLTINDFDSYEFVSQGANGCDSISTLIVSDGQPSAPLVYSSGPVSCPKDLVNFEVSNVNTGATYEWFGPNFTSLDVSNEIQLTEDLAGVYGVSYNLNGCSSDTTYITLEIANEFEFQTFEFPNVITANGDGKNDEINLDVFVGPCAQFILTVRDRWGSEVYRQERGGESFKGLSVDGRELPEGVYFYRFIFDQDEDLSGFLHIVR
tara:strand:+ start:1414 stop:3330 length:1917 start_codon:yes stop_codon:yes gene_type:complete